MKNKKFVHCPKPGCDKPLRGSWKDYLTGELHPKTKLPVYRCPNCHLKFTADSFKANAIPVTDDNKDVILYDTNTKKVLDIIPSNMKFTDGEFSYVHIPLNLCTTDHIKCLSFEARGMTNEEIASMCEGGLKSKIEVIR